MINNFETTYFDTLSFFDILAIVKYKMSRKQPMETDKEKLMENFLLDWVEKFGYDAL